MSQSNTALRAVPEAFDAEHRLARTDWAALSGELDRNGCAVIEALLTPAECRELASLYAQDDRFRSHIHMARHGFGRGEYKYFKYPLPDPIGALRSALYPHLAEVANSWNGRMGIATRYPAKHAAFLKQ